MNYRLFFPLGALAAGLLTACGGSVDPVDGPGAGNGQLTDPATVASSTPVSPDMTYLIRDNGVSAPGGVSTTIAGGNTPTAGGNARVYVIEAGDLCSTIAEELEVSVDELLDSNPGTDCSVLIPGTELRVPAGGTGGSTPTPTPDATTPGGTPAADTTPTPGAGGGEYEIQPGDICVDIAASHDVDVDDLIAANNLDCDNLTVGETITIP